MKTISFLLFTLLLPVLTLAKTITVTNNADTGIGTLREAIENAEENDTIIFDNSVTSITLKSGLIIEKSITINGSSSNNVTINMANDAVSFRRHLTIRGMAENVSLSYLTLNNGRMTTTCAGAIYYAVGNLIIDHCNFNNNYSSTLGGAIYAHGKKLQLSNCKFDGNYGMRSGGVIHIGENCIAFIENNSFKNNSAANAAVIYNVGTTIINQCEFKKNSSDYYGVIYNSTKGIMTINNSIFDQNQYNVDGTFNNAGKATIVNCLFTNNQVSSQPGHAYLLLRKNVISNRYGNDGDLTIINSTIANNVGIGLTLENTVTLYNNIFWNNTIPNFNAEYDIYDSNEKDYSLTVFNNLIGTSNIDLSGNNNLIGEDPLFVGDGDYSLQKNSPAIDKGNNTYLNAEFIIDLAGNPRISNGTVDMGAYEYQQGTVSVNSISNDEVKVYAYDRIVVVENAHAPVTIYNLTGGVVGSAGHTGTVAITVSQAGVYIVRTGSEARKVVVK